MNRGGNLGTVDMSSTVGAAGRATDAVRATSRPQWSP